MTYGLSVDIDAVLCVDTGHHWTETFFGRVPSGPLKGTPCRGLVCKTCGSAKIERLNWRGKVVGRIYDHDETYITMARELGDHNDRRRNLRMAKAARLKKEGQWGKAPWDEED